MSTIKYHNKNEKIYSRKRIIIPRVQYYKTNNTNKNYKNQKSIIKILIIFIIEILVARNIINAINPIIDTQCVNQAKNIATIITNEQSSIVMGKYKYEDLATVIKDDNGKIQMVKLNIIPVNEIISDVAIRVQNELNNVETADMGIRLGSFSGSKLPIPSPCATPFVTAISISNSCIGNVGTDLKSEFKSVGINQTLHQVYLDIDCEVMILTPYNTKNEKIKNQVLIAESIIVGEIPNTYYNLDGVDSSSAMKIIE